MSELNKAIEAGILATLPEKKRKRAKIILDKLNELKLTPEEVQAGVAALEKIVPLILPFIKIPEADLAILKLIAAIMAALPK
jgi:hypothetical protein